MLRLLSKETMGSSRTVRAAGRWEGRWSQGRARLIWSFMKELMTVEKQERGPNSGSKSQVWVQKASLFYTLADSNALSTPPPRDEDKRHNGWGMHNQFTVVSLFSRRIYKQMAKWLPNRRKTRGLRIKVRRNLCLFYSLESFSCSV